MALVLVGSSWVLFSNSSQALVPCLVEFVAPALHQFSPLPWDCFSRRCWKEFGPGRFLERFPLSIFVTWWICSNKGNSYSRRCKSWEAGQLKMRLSEGTFWVFVWTKHDRYFEIIDVFCCFCLVPLLESWFCFRYAGTWQIAEHESYNWQQFYLGTSCAQDLFGMLGKPWKAM